MRSEASNAVASDASNDEELCKVIHLWITRNEGTFLRLAQSPQGYLQPGLKTLLDPPRASKAEAEGMRTNPARTA